MNMVFRILPALGLLLFAHGAQAQVAQVQSSCAALSLAAGYSRPLNETTGGDLCVNATVNASVASPSTNSASTIVTGGTFQTIAAASLTRKSLEFQNVCLKSGNCTATTNLCYLYIAASGSGSTSNSLIVQPGQEYLRSSGVIPSDAISATCDGTGDKFYLAVQ